MPGSSQLKDKTESFTPETGLVDILTNGSNYSRATESPFEPEFFYLVDRGTLLSKQLNRRLVEYFNFDSVVVFSHGVSVALNPILFRNTQYTAFLPHSLYNVPAVNKFTWIKPLKDFNPGRRTLLHFHAFCSNAQTFQTFVSDNADRSAKTTFDVAIADMQYLATRDLLADWHSDRPHIELQNYDLPSATTQIFLNVPAEDLKSMAEVITLGQRRDRLLREFLAGRKSPLGAPDTQDLMYVAQKAETALKTADLGIQFTAQTSVEALIKQAKELREWHEHYNSTALQWMQRFHSQAKPFAEGSLDESEYSMWLAFVTFYSAANYALGMASYGDEPSKTIDLLRANELQWKDVQPKAAAAQYAYDVHYTYDVILRNGKGTHRPSLPASSERPPLSVPIPMQNPNGHHARLQFVSGQVKFLAATLLKKHGPDYRFRWLDVGCGNGVIANSVDFEEAGVRNYEVVGLDLGAPQIEQANANAAWNRCFYHQDLRTMDAAILGSGFDLVTAFEVSEHLRDPLSFFKICASASRNYLMFGSPLEELVTPFSCEQHLFSFSRLGFEELIKKAGFDVFMSNEMRLGSYNAGNDWLTIVGRRPS